MIKLLNNLVVSVDDLSYTLQKYEGKQVVTVKDKETGLEKQVEKDKYTPIGYFASLKGALLSAKEYLFKQNLKDSVKTLDEAFKELIRINKEFENIISK